MNTFCYLLKSLQFLYILGVFSLYSYNFFILLLNFFFLLYKVLSYCYFLLKISCILCFFFFSFVLKLFHQHQHIYWDNWSFLSSVDSFYDLIIFAKWFNIIYTYILVNPFAIAWDYTEVLKFFNVKKIYWYASKIKSKQMNGNQMRYFFKKT